MRHTIALIALTLAGCTSQQVKIDPPPTIVRVTVDRYVPIPPALTARMDAGRPDRQDYQVAKDLALLRLRVIQAGNCRLLRIASLGQPLGDQERAEWQANECAGEAPATAPGTGPGKP